MVQGFQADVGADYGVGLPGTVGDGRADLLGGVEQIRRGLDLPGTGQRGFVPVAMPWIVADGVVGAFVVTQDGQRGVEIDETAARRCFATLNALYEIGGIFRCVE